LFGFIVLCSSSTLLGFSSSWFFSPYLEVFLWLQGKVFHPVLDYLVMSMEISWYVWELLVFSVHCMVCIHCLEYANLKGFADICRKHLATISGYHDRTIFSVHWSRLTRSSLYLCELNVIWPPLLYTGNWEASKQSYKTCNELWKNIMKLNAAITLQ